MSIKDRRQAAREKARRLQEEDERRLKKIQECRQKVFLALDEISESEENIALSMRDMLDAGITKKKIQQDFAMSLAEVNRYLSLLEDDTTAPANESDHERSESIEENITEADRDDIHEGATV